MRVVKKAIPSSEGNLSTAIHYPRIESDRLAILCPGFLDTKDYPHLVRLAETLASRGYMVIRFDPTGTWESEGGSRKNRLRRKKQGVHLLSIVSRSILI